MEKNFEIEKIEIIVLEGVYIEKILLLRRGIVVIVIVKNKDYNF